MRKKLPEILVTGGAGFIGSAFVRLAARKGHRVVVVDKLTYAGDMQRLKDVQGEFIFYKADICDKTKIGMIFKKEKPESVVNFAAESHVDRSILDASPFIRTNIQGTQVLLGASRQQRVHRFIHISTDEVYGDIEKGAFNEDSPFKPSSPYAASKASSDLLIQSYIRTFGFPAIIVRPSNNYGPWQYPEKLIPRAIMRVLKNEKVPVYAKGENVREWLYVEDCVEGIYRIVQKGKAGEAYNLGSAREKKNIEVVGLILKALKADKGLIEFVKDRPGHDIRYRLNSQKLFNETGWKPKIRFEDGIKLTVAWNLAHKGWLFGKYKEITQLYSRR